jgi:hypothetical protein
MVREWSTQAAADVSGADLRVLRGTALAADALHDV